MQHRSRARCGVLTVGVFLGLAITAVPRISARADVTLVDQWTRRASFSYPGSEGTPIVYDTMRTEVLRLGGSLAPDMWGWDGSTWTRHVAASTPPSRDRAAMAYDEARGETVLFGGFSSSFSLLGDTWTWDGGTWTQHTPPTSPPARSGASMVYDSIRGETVLFGGSSASEQLADTWVWDGSTWTQRYPTISPPVRSNAAMAYDAGHAHAVLFGGTGVNWWESYADTWTWDGTTWTRRTPAASPSARSSAAVAYDTTRAEIVLFGGYSGPYRADTWAWDGTTWTEHLSVGSPPGRQGAGMAYDGARGEIVLFGGYGGGTSWETDTWVYVHVSLAAPGTASGYASDGCAGGTEIVDGFAGSTYVQVHAIRADSRTTWVCVRANSPSQNLGGRFSVTDAATGSPEPPTADGDVGACATSPGNAIPGQHPIEAGSVGDPSDPSTYVPFVVDAYATIGEAWICLGIGAFRQRVVVPAAGLSPPVVTFTPDRSGNHVPEATLVGTPSETCQAGGGESGRLVDLTVAGTSARLHTWQPSASVVKLCARVDGVVMTGGMLTVDTTLDDGVLPSVTTSTTDLGQCTLSVVKFDGPGIEIRRSATGALPASMCIVAGTTRLRVTVSTGDGPPSVPAAWTPDPATPGRA